MIWILHNSIKKHKNEVYNIYTINFDNLNKIEVNLHAKKNPFRKYCAFQREFILSYSKLYNYNCK